MIILNPSHHHTEEHLERVEALTEQKVVELIEVRAPVDHAQPFAGQAGVVRELA